MTAQVIDTPGLSLQRLRLWLAEPQARGVLITLLVLTYPIAIGSLQQPPEGYELPLEPWLWDLLLGAGMATTITFTNLLKVPFALTWNLLVWLLAGFVGAILPVVVSIVVSNPKSHVLTGWPLAWVGNVGLLLFILILISARLEYRTSNKELSEKIWRLRNRNQWLSDQLEQHSRGIKEGLILEVGPKLREIKDLVLAGNFKSASSELEILVDYVVRPASQELNQSPFRMTPKNTEPRYLILTPGHARKTLLRQVGASAVFATPVGLILGLIFLLNAAVMANDLSGGLFITGYLSLVTLLFTGLSRALRKTRAPYLVLLVLNVVLATVVGIGHLELGLLLGLADDFGLLSFISLGVTLIFLGSGFTSLYLAAKQATNQESLAIASALSAAVAELQIRTLAVRRRLAIKVHGEFQAYLQVTLAKLRRGDNSSSEEIASILSEIEQAHALFDGPSTTDDMGLGLLRLQEQWAGICDVELQISESADLALQSDQGLAEVVFEICRERVINAVKHSGVEAIEITLDSDANHLILNTQNEDFGVGFASDSTSGLGSQILDQACSEWALKLEDSRAIFWAKILHSGTKG